MNNVSDVAGAAEGEEPSPPKLNLFQIFLRFLRFGFLAWGGPFAQIAMIRRELVDEERWISSARFNRLLAVYQALPGPEAHELCVHLGILAGGRPGGFVAGLGFMLPGFTMIMCLAYLYASSGLEMSGFQSLLTGVQIAVIAMIVRALHRIGEHILIDRWLWAICAIGTAATALGVSFWLNLPVAGLSYSFVKASKPIAAVATVIVGVLIFWLTGTATDISQVMTAHSMPADIGNQIPNSTLQLFLSGLKAGLLTFGGAYTAIPFIRGDAVGNGWMSDSQFLDGLGLSSLLPAPLIIFATFVGYVSGGPMGALAMTAGVFLPAFGLSILFFDRLEQVVQNASLHRFLEGVAAAVVGMVVFTAFGLANTVAEGISRVWAGLFIFAVVLAILYRSKSKISVVYAVAAAGVLGAVTLGD